MRDVKGGDEGDGSIESARPRGYENRLVAILAMGGGVAALDAQAVFYLMPFLVVDLSLNNMQVGTIGASVLASASVSALIMSWLSDRAGRRKPFLVGVFLSFSLLSMVSALAWSYLSLLLSRLVMGFAEGPVIPLKQSIVLAESSPHRRGLNMGIVQNFGAQLMGALIAPIAAVWIATHHGWRTVFFLSGVPGIIVAALIIRYLREPPKRAAVLATAPRPQLKTLLGFRNMRICMLISACSVGWIFLLLSFLPLWTVREVGLTPQVMSFIVAMTGLAGAVSAIFVPALSDRFGRRPVLILFAAIGLVAPLGALLAWSNVILLCALTFAGCLMMGIFPIFMATVPLETVGQAQAAMASAVVIAFGQIVGGVGGPLAGGALADMFGLQAPLLLSAALAAGAAILGLWLVETHRVARNAPLAPMAAPHNSISAFQEG